MVLGWKRELHSNYLQFSAPSFPQSLKTKSTNQHPPPNTQENKGTACEKREKIQIGIVMKESTAPHTEHTGPFLCARL